MADSVRQQAESRDVAERVVGWVIFAAALVFYAVLAPAFSVPGRWADMLVAMSGLDPLRPVLRPLWSGLMTLLAALPLSNLSQAANLCSAVTGAAACAVFYGIVRRIPFARSRGWRERDEADRGPRMVAGVVAALCAAVSTPTIIVSTRGDYIGLGVLLLLLAFAPSLRYLRTPRVWQLYASGLCLGLGLAEYPAMLWVAPLCAVWWAALVWGAGRGHARHLVAALLLAAGVCALVVGGFARAYAASPVAAWRDMAGAAAVAAEFARYHVIEMTRSVPKVGWLLIFCVSVLPFLALLFRELDEPRDRYSAIGSYAFRLILVAVAVITLLDLPGAPLRAAGSRTLLVAPVFLVALWFGYLIGYYVRLFHRHAARWPSALILAAAAALIGVAAVRHTRETSVRHLAPVADATRRLVLGLEGRTWVVTDGTLDAMLRLAAREASVPLRVLTGETTPTDLRNRSHASLFDDPGLKSLATVGLRPALAEWLQRDAAITGKLAVLVAPELVETERLQAVPAALHLQLADAAAGPDPQALWASHERAWSDLVLPDIDRVKQGEAGWLQAFFVVRWTSRMANDLGVYLDDRHLPDLARQAYERALAIWPDNISATLNLLADSRRRGVGDVEALRKQLEAQLARNRGLFPLRYVPQFCGAVRTAAASLEEAAELGRAGQSSQALARLGEAASLLDPADEAGRVGLAKLYLDEQHPGESEAVLNQLLEKNPNSLAALQGLLRVALQRGRQDDARALLDRLAAAGLDPSRLALEQARVDMLAGDLPKARARLQLLVRQPEVSIDTWYTLALVGLLTDDRETFERAAPALDANRLYRPGLMLLGDEAWRARNLAKARSCFEQVLALDGLNRRALERLVLLHYAERDVERLRDRSAALLSTDPNHALGHFGVANVHLASGRLDLAEASLRRCLESRENGQAHNDLAWILGETGRFDEARSHAQRAVELNPDDANAWDTLAVIELKRGDTGRAVEAIEKAQALAEGRSPGILISAARIYHAAGRIESALRMLEILKSMRAVLPAQRIREIDELARSIDGDTGSPAP